MQSHRRILGAIIAALVVIAVVLVGILVTRADGGEEATTTRVTHTPGSHTQTATQPAQEPDLYGEATPEPGTVEAGGAVVGLGETVTVGGGAVSVTVIDMRSGLTASEFMAEDYSNRFAVEVAVCNNTNESVSISLDPWGLGDTTGYIYDAESVFGDSWAEEIDSVYPWYDDLLPMVNGTPTCRRGWMIFEPRDLSTVEHVTYAPNDYSGATYTWNFG